MYFLDWQSLHPAYRIVIVFGTAVVIISCIVPWSRHLHHLSLIFVTSLDDCYYHQLLLQDLQYMYAAAAAAVANDDDELHCVVLFFAVCH